MSDLSHRRPLTGPALAHWVHHGVVHSGKVSQDKTLSSTISNHRSNSLLSTVNIIIKVLSAEIWSWTWKLHFSLLFSQCWVSVSACALGSNGHQPAQASSEREETRRLETGGDGKPWRNEGTFRGTRIKCQDELFVEISTYQKIYMFIRIRNLWITCVCEHL